MTDKDVISEVQHYLKFVKSFGCTGLSCTPETMGIIESWQPRPDANPKPQPAPSPPLSQPESSSQPESLESMGNAIHQCRRCRLFGERKSAVFGSGPETAKLMLIGGFPEAADEDSGMPYSGEEGELLTRIIEAIKFERESVYICHMVKCRPKDGNAPDRFVAKACRTWLDRQINAIHPAIICVFGELAAQVLLRTDMPLDRLRGRFHDYDGIPVMPTLDPGHLLANQDAKRAVWEDMKRVMKACKDLNIY